MGLDVLHAPILNLVESSLFLLLVMLSVSNGDEPIGRQHDFAVKGSVDVL